jgi:sigma-54 specific flagellar transcriptional regulator A
MAVETAAASSAVLPRGGLDLKEHLNNIEYSLIMQALNEAGGVVAHAAELLRLRRTTLVEKLRKYGVRSEATRQDFDESVTLHD